MKRILPALLSLALLFSLASCKSDSYLDDVKVNTLSDAVITALNDTDYTTADDGFLDDYFTTPDYVTDYTVCFATEGNNLNEFGIYHVTAGNAETMKGLLQKYLTDSYAKNQSWYDSYIPEETPKLRDAEVKVFGNYVVYAICSKEARATVFSSVEGQLAK